MSAPHAQHCSKPPLRHARQFIEQRAGGGLVLVVSQPDFGQALVGR